MNNIGYNDVRMYFPKTDLKLMVSQYYTHDTWINLVQEYSRRQLTYPSDRLPALHGLQAELKRQLGSDTYIFGMWSSDLVRQLLWTQPYFIQAGTFNDAQDSIPDWSNIPSWSWVASERPIDWHWDFTGRMLSARKSNWFPFSQVTAAGEIDPHNALRIRGPLMTLNRCSTTFDVKTSDRTLVVRSESQISPIASFAISCVYYTDRWFLKYAGGSETEDTNVLESTSILPMLWYESRESCGARCLLLWKGPGLPMGVYRRVGGVAMLSRHKESNMNKVRPCSSIKPNPTVLSDFEFYRKCFAEHQGSLAEEDFLEYDGSGLYTIEIR